MSRPQIIAFYLPQYHPIPENDLWWGKGFTDWTNVVKVKKKFFGHYQPHLPSDLGFYDLRLEEVRLAQAELARAYGISGFCYYHYWFNGKMLLEKPFNEVLKTGKPDFPFCLCWANENWTRRWDGNEKDILIEQNYTNYNAEEHLLWLLKAFKDKRYIKINGKPLFLIYSINNIPFISEILKSWRNTAQKNSISDLFICSIKSVYNKMTEKELLNLGFDRVVDFTPNSSVNFKMKILNIPKNYFYRTINKILNVLGLNKLPVAYVYSYKSLMKNKIKNISTQKNMYPCVMPNWDNSPRRKFPYVFQNNDQGLFKFWLEKAIENVRKFPQEEQIVFINAWNEWAEGCHLEPDIRNGKKFLEAVLETVNKVKYKI